MVLMTIATMTTLTASNEAAELEAFEASSRRTDTRADSHSDVETDVLLQLKSNLAQLEDMHGRMKYMMGELSYLLVKRS